ncbi:alpha/beta fold hydrolase [Mycolicibacterium iranicum]|uniref:Alpha/beta fold hydrolase n=1 Tax=Mycolicibacterium iranicum TaxID=912594 RepID=A0A1X1WV76_MYCIR|nr:lipase family protein [Mycolicibacterium iranicum]MCZ0730102.1 alpha/beta fold hydrolase [Mycolicibacterium iranicum]ORV90545.1 hypothetical protein AWC12_07320 [Mycolicibacterium iranicum]
MLAVLLLIPVMALSLYEPRAAPAPLAAPIVAPLPAVTGEVWNRRGRVVAEERYEPVGAGPESAIGQAWKATYTSVSGVDGGAREVTGLFSVPEGTPPVGGWPVVSLAHGTTGIGHNCGPAQQPDLQGYGPIIEAWLAAGYAVAATDYEGLGPTGFHLYLEPRSAAFNTIDAVRALRDLSPAVSTRWVAVGYSQGGQAVWAANELNSFYGDGLDLLGSVALAPAANVTDTADKVWSGSLSAPQRNLFPTFIVGLARFNPDLDEYSFLHGSTEAYRERLSFCEPNEPNIPVPAILPVPWAEVADRMRGSRETKPESLQDIDDLRDAMRKVALPQRPLQSPMLVVIGLDDLLVFPREVRVAVAQSCAMGGRIQLVEIPGADHIDMLWQAGPYISGWVEDRFSGLPAPSNCTEEPLG